MNDERPQSKITPGVNRELAYRHAEAIHKADRRGLITKIGRAHV